jgi:hypothetical protein
VLGTRESANRQSVLFWPLIVDVILILVVATQGGGEGGGRSDSLRSLQHMQHILLLCVMVSPSIWRHSNRKSGREEMQTMLVLVVAAAVLENEFQA